MRFFHNDHMAHKPLHVDSSDNMRVAVSVFFAVTFLVGIGLFSFFANILPMFAIVLVSFSGGIAAAVVVVKMFAREKAEYISQIDEDLRANKEAEAQKQIDAMLRENSKIPEVKR